MTSTRSVVLTGSPGIGKTTLVCKIVEYFRTNGVDVRGFYTTERRREGQRVGFDLVTLCGKTLPLATKRGEGRKTGLFVGNYEVEADTFGDTVLPILREIFISGGSQTFTNKNILLVLDEIGKMELLNDKFAEEMERLFEERRRRGEGDRKEVVILATVPERSNASLVENIKRHSHVKLFQVSRTNRDSLKDPIVTLIKSLLTPPSSPPLPS